MEQEMLAFMVCETQDSTGEVCGKKMTSRENTEDGMCAACAGHVWNEMNHEDYKWKHENRRVGDE